MNIEIPDARAPFTSSRRTPSPNAEALSPNTERFPSLDVSRPNGNLNLVASPAEATPLDTVLETQKWPARKSSQWSRQNGRIHSVPAHRPRRSISDAVRNFRNRQGSVSDNAQELAQALKAPLSYKLIVS